MEYKTNAYKIFWVDDPEKFYVGGTKQTLSRRMSVHRDDARKGKGKKNILYDVIRTKGYNFEYRLLGSKMVTCRDEERQFEQEWIDHLHPPLNKNRAHGLDVVKDRQRENSPVYCKYCDNTVHRSNIRKHNKTKKHIKNFIMY